jgi:hypothetical protein
VLPERACTQRAPFVKLLERARAIAKTGAYAVSRRERKKVEMLFAHLKRILRLDRLRLRGPRGAKDGVARICLADSAPNPKWWRHNRGFFNKIRPERTFAGSVRRGGQRHKDVGPGRVRAEPRQQAVTAVAPSSTAAWHSMRTTS